MLTQKLLLYTMILFDGSHEYGVKPTSVTSRYYVSTVIILAISTPTFLLLINATDGKDEQDN